MLRDDVQIIGLDCAVQPKNVGVALATANRVEQVVAGIKNPLDVIVEWLDPHAPALVAVDAPLGWPSALKKELPGHRPGEAWESSPDELFRRATDRFVQSHYRRPLDVGADRIARTAHAALDMLSRLRKFTGRSFPLLWSSSETNRTGVIEVYPAATLVAHQIKIAGYKSGKNPYPARRRIIDSMREHLDITVSTDELIKNDDALDAVVCVLAAQDFLNGQCWSPDESMAAAKTEGWIWVRRTPDG